MHIKNKTTNFLLIFAMIMFTGNLCLNAVTYVNGSEGAFEEPPPEETAAVSSVTLSIKDLIINGAVAFLKGSEDISGLSHEYELTELNGVNISILKGKADAAFENMGTAISYYSQLETKANFTPYNQTVIDKLTTFDYRTFRKDNGLNKQVMNDVEEYLSCGDVRGCFTRIKNDAQSILNALQALKSALNNGTLPANKAIWNLNQEIAIFHLFGQYITRVFSTIKNRVRS